MITYAFRLRPNQDLKQELDRFAHDNAIEAACILACVGSLRRAVIRFADQPEGSVYQAGPDRKEPRFEIVSLTGTLSRHGSHYHIAISDPQGKTLGGHLMDGCLIYTTAEVVVGVLPGVRFLREQDDETGYPELFVQTDPQ
jgi:uncharacterized protein